MKNVLQSQDNRQSFIWDQPWLVLTTVTTGRGPGEGYIQRTAFWESETVKVALCRPAVRLQRELRARGRETEVGRKYFKLLAFERIVCGRPYFLRHSFYFYY